MSDPDRPANSPNEGHPGRTSDSPAADPVETGQTATDRAAIDRAESYHRRRRIQEIWLVLGLSLGQSAVYSVISLTAKLTAGRPLAQQTATLNAPASARPYVDLAYQLADVVFTVVPAALALWLLTEAGRTGARRLGLDARRPGRDLAEGALLALVIGLPGLGLYVLGRHLGITATVVPSALHTYWWTIPVLVLQALKNGLIEEVVVVGYLMTRLRELRLPVWAVLGCSAVLRGSYHLYQGFGPFLGNAVMGLVFGEWFRRRGRVMPLVIAHTLLDVVSFVGYDLFAGPLHLR
ncbi:MAG TPA: type II CAAX endopeptidase family protein [Kineosporiaceae bacterium]|nr:type II CAAX endopeptidase family protein [Kineosporiaceae bacterium]